MGPKSVRANSSGPIPSNFVVPEPQYEQPWEMTSASSGQLIGIIALCAVNIFGVAWLTSLMVSRMREGSESS